MSWRENVQVEFVIQTGDEKQYRPKGWLNASFEKSFNISKFEFPNTPGTYIRKTEPKGRVYNLEIYFQGDDHLREARAFEISTNDIRHWHVLHPLYGSLRVQPGTLRFDNSNHNFTKITGSLLETILGDLPRGTSSFKDIIIVLKVDGDLALSGAYVAKNPSPSAQDQLTLTDDFKVVTKDVSRLIIDQDEANRFNQFVAEANSSITSFSVDPLKAMRDIQSTLNYPSALNQTISARLDLYTTQFNSTLNTIVNFPLDNLLNSQKAYFETIAGTILGAMALVSSSSQSPDDYGSRDNVLDIIDRLILLNDKYIETLDLIQTGDGTQLDSFIPDADAIRQLTSTISFSISNLFEIAFDSKQEREIVLERDTNLIILAHRFYGPDSTDENINELIRNNGYSIKQHLLIKKGTIAKYFV